MDRHRFDAHPDPAFHFYADPDLYPDPINSFTRVGKSGAKNLTLTCTAPAVLCFIFLVSVIIFNMLDSMVNCYFLKKVCSSLLLVETDPALLGLFIYESNRNAGACFLIIVSGRF